MTERNIRTLRGLKILLPTGLRPFTKSLLAKIGLPQFKYSEELDYWRQRFKNGKWMLEDYYQARLLEIAGEADQNFVADKVIADFGCGPRGSLCWAAKARSRIGLDVLAIEYTEFDIADQNMIYVVCSEKEIPLPTKYVDVLFTMNSLDHASHLNAICKEFLRIIKPGGILIGSFNLHEQGTFSEPQTLTEAKLDRLLLHAFAPVRRQFIKNQWGTASEALWFRGVRNKH
jgi:SAM-dependent methyltransferase